MNPKDRLTEFTPTEPCSPALEASWQLRLESVQWNAGLPVEKNSGKIYRGKIYRGKFYRNRSTYPLGTAPRLPNGTASTEKFCPRFSGQDNEIQGLDGNYSSSGFFE